MIVVREDNEMLGSERFVSGRESGEGGGQGNGSGAPARKEMEREKEYWESQNEDAIGFLCLWRFRENNCTSGAQKAKQYGRRVLYFWVRLPTRNGTRAHIS